MRRIHPCAIAFQAISFLVLLCTTAKSATAREPCTACEIGATTVTAIRGRPGWRCATSRNFRVVCHTRAGDANSIAEHCEKLRGALCERWFPDQHESTWDPRCEIVVHQDAASYLQAVGRGASSTSGSADVKTDQYRVVSRRVDLRADKSNLLTAALPHEMTHVVVADWMKGKPWPLWAEEGMAMLADPAEKQARHTSDLETAFASGSAFSAAELLTLEAYPSHDRWPAFYAQSHALVAYLVKKESPERFVKFLGSVEENGYDSALDEHYGIRAVGALRLAWRETGKHRAVSMHAEHCDLTALTQVDALASSR